MWGLVWDRGLSSGLVSYLCSLVVWARVIYYIRSVSGFGPRGAGIELKLSVKGVHLGRGPSANYHRESSTHSQLSGAPSSTTPTPPHPYPFGRYAGKTWSNQHF